VADVVKDWAAFELAAPPLAGAVPVRGLKRGRPVSAGEILARHPQARRGDLPAPVAGFIEEVSEEAVVIRRDEAAVGEPPPLAAPADLAPPDLGRALKELGLDLFELPPGDPLIISTLDPEPGLTFSRPLLAEHRETLAAGLAALRRLFSPGRLIWAGLRPEDAPPEAGEFIRLRAGYPWTLPALVKKRVTGRLDPAGRGVLDLRGLFDLGRVFRTGRPLVRMVLSLGGANYFVPLGARPADLLAFAHLWPNPGDAVVAGGLVRGRTLARLTRGLGRAAAGLHLVRRAAAVAAGPCRRCGGCARACPAGLPVEEFFRRGPHPGEGPAPPDDPWAGCLDCGACALACPARRPLLAWARLKTTVGPSCP
jgi:electron transport complex protein RnfC